MSIPEYLKTETGSSKFVRVKGEYRFCTLKQDHISLVTEDELFNDGAESAGFIHWSFGVMVVSPMISTGLQIGPAPEDGENIAKLLNLKLRK